MEICKKLILKYKDKLKQYRFIIVQHLMTDTMKFITTLFNCGIEIDIVFAKEYSVNMNIFTDVKKIVPTEVLGNNSEVKCRRALEKSISLSNKDNKHIVILDLGGEYASILKSIKPQSFQIIVVEDTAYGHRKYEATHINNQSIRIFSVAQSMFKEIEAKFVGNSIVCTAENVFRSIGNTIIGKNVLVIGYGMIGKNVAETLKSFKCKVAVYDTNNIKLCHAFFDGYQIGNLKELCFKYNIIFGVTGNCAISKDDIYNFANTTYLISGSSKQAEFSSNIFDEYNKTNVNQYVTNYYTNSKKIYLFNNGFPINFISNSVPDSIIDFVFSEMIACIIESTDISADNKIYQAQGKVLEEIADLFIKKSRGCLL